MSRKLDELRDRLCEELYNFAKKIPSGEMSGAQLEVIDKLTHSIKSIDTIAAMEESYPREDEESYQRNGRMPYMNTSDYSARGRVGNVRRDSRGRYANRNYYRTGDYGNDENREIMLDHIEDMLNEAQDERQRQMIMNWKHQIESM